MSLTPAARPPGDVVGLDDGFETCTCARRLASRFSLAIHQRG